MTKKYTTKQIRDGIIGGLIISGIVLGLLVFFADSDDAETKAPGLPEFSHAVPYKFIEIVDVSYAARSRAEGLAVLNDPLMPYLTELQLAETAMAAAVKLQQETGAQVAWVRLIQTPVEEWSGVLLAIATYAPDGRGLSGEDNWTWEVEAADKPLNETELSIRTLWDGMKKEFKTSDGLTDEPTLKAVVAEALEIPVDELKIPWAPTLKRFAVQ